MAVRRRTNAYWAKRADERLLDSEKTSETYRKKVREVYAEAQRETLKQLKQIYSTYWSKDSGFNKQKLNTLTTISDMNRFVAELKKSGLYDQIPDNYKGRITRLEYLNAQMWLEAHKAGLKQDELVTESNRKVYEDSYYRSIFDVSKGIGSTPAFNTLDTATVNKALEAKFDGKNYSERIWGNSDILANQLQAKLAVAIATGQSIHKTAREFRERFHVQNYYAERLIRTETNYFHNSAEIESYKSMGFEYFQFLATLDNRTSEICQDMDGKKFKVSEGMSGENIPPLHPNCRSTIVPYFKDYEPEQRIARNPATGRNYHVSNINYATWKQEFVDKVINNVAGGELFNQIITTKYGVSFDPNTLWGVDGKVIKSYSRAARKLMKKFPEVKDWSLENSDNGLTIMGEEFGGGVMAATNRSQPLISLNPKYHYSIDYLRKIVSRNIKRHHFMSAKDIDNYVFYHEFGHHIENYLINTKSLSDKQIKHAIIDIACEKYGMLGNEISKYGGKNSREFFAETFANYMAGKPNNLGKAMGAFLKEVMRNDSK